VAPEPIEALILDLDGTLIDSVADIAASVNHARTARLGLAPLGEAEIAPMIGDGVAVLLERALGPRRDLPDIIRVYREHYAAHCLDRTRPYPGVPETLEALAARLPGRVVVLTNKPEAPTRRILERFDLARHLEAAIGGDSGHGRKPDPSAFAAARRALGDPPRERVLVVGDGLTDLDGGRLAGLKTCGVTYGIGAPDLVRAARPDYVIDAFPELLSLVESLGRAGGGDGSVPT